MYTRLQLVRTAWLKYASNVNLFFLEKPVHVKEPQVWEINHVAHYGMPRHDIVV